MRNTGRFGKKEQGQAAIEMALLSPWILLLFMAVLDFGFYAYAVISVENAARAAALYASSSTAAATDSTTACYYAIQELSGMANVSGLSGCSALPLKVSATSVAESDGTTGARVTVTYQTVALIPLPWLPGTYTVTRIVDMMVAPES